MKRYGFRMGGLSHSRLVRFLSVPVNRKKNYIKKGAAVCLTFALTVVLLHSGKTSLLSLIQKAAVLSAALTMPEAGIGQIQERYQDILTSSNIDLPSSVDQAFQPDMAISPFLNEEESKLLDGTVQISSQVSSDTASVSEPLTEEISVFPSDSSASSPVYKITSPSASSRYIPSENRGMILSQTFSAVESPIYIKYGQGVIKNSTSLTNAQTEEILDTPCSIDIADLSQPTVLIYHTHATEAYEPFDSDYFDKTYNWRSDDNDKNMVAVGRALAQKLEQAGIGVVHVDEQHDNPSYNGAYDKSAQTIQDALEKYPTIRVILDIHRDAIQRDPDTIVKAIADIDGKKAAQLMIIAGCDNDGSLGMPQWKQNLRFSAALQDILETMYPGLCRPVFFCYRKYNMDLCPNGALIEIGSHGNTLEEAVYTAELLGNALILLLQGQE